MGVQVPPSAPTLTTALAWAFVRSSPSYVFRSAGFKQTEHPSKLQSEDIEDMVNAMLGLHDRGLTSELTVFATNPVA